MRPVTALVVALAVLTPVQAQPVQTVLFPGLSGQPLLDAIRASYRPASTLGYDAARDAFMSWEQQYAGRLTCVYSGYTVTLSPGADPSSSAYSQGIDTEHTWPQSQGTADEPRRSDIHHLFATRSSVNSARGNLPFGESPDAQTSTWYRLAATQTSIPSSFLAEWSERQGSVRFEPREDHKGNAARAMFYMRAVYPEMVSSSSGAAFFEGQKATLLAWAVADPVNAFEYDRSAWIATRQGTHNPFVLDSTLARRAFAPGSGNPDPDPDPDPDPNPDPPASAGVFLNELHYDNVGADAGEFVEVAAPLGTDLTTVTLTLYNGNGGAVYGAFSLSTFVPGETTEGYRLYTLTLPSNGIQNGPPDGISLSVGSAVVQFLSYEGTFVAVGGPADGMTSVDIGVSETDTTPTGQSLQLKGTGSAYADFAWAGPSAASPGAVNAGQTFEPAEEPAPEPTYTVTAPLAGTSILAGARTLVRWTGPGVPNTADLVSVYLRKGSGAELLLGSGPNRGRLRVTIPAGTVTGSDYAFVVRRQADPSVYGASDPVIVYTTGDQFTFTEPDGGETWARGTTKTVNWTTPPTAPSGTVTVRWYRGSGLLLETYAGETNDGSLSVSVPANLTTGDFYFTIVADADPAFFGQSNTFSIQRFEGTSPAEGATWAAGSPQTVTWTPGANTGGQLRVALRSRTSSYIAVISPYGPYTDFSRTITVPAGAPAGEYEVQYLHRYTPPGGVEARTFVYSNAITVTNPVAPTLPARHFDAPLAAEGARETMVVVTGLADGTEVGVFAPMGEGEVLLAAGVVENGEAVVAVPSDVIDAGLLSQTGDAEASSVSFGSAALTVRALVNGRETSVGTTALSPGEVQVVPAASAAAGEGPTFAVAGVVPNPTSSGATVRFTLPSSEAVTVTVYDMLGRTVATLFDGTASAGANAVSVPASLNAGVYVVRVSTASTSASARFTVIR